MPTGRELYERGIAAFSDMERHAPRTWEELGPGIQQDLERDGRTADS